MRPALVRGMENLRVEDILYQWIDDALAGKP